MVTNGEMRACRRWEELDVLVIDEVSMLEPGLFTFLDRQARRSRDQQRDLPFGGVQLILIGDYFQLPPVSTEKGRSVDRVEFVFELPLYTSMGFLNVELQQVFRQKDREFVALLENMRRGKVSREQLLSIWRCMKRPPVAEQNGIQYTKLFGKRQDVAANNRKELLRVQAESAYYKTEVSFEEGGETLSKKEKEKLQSQVLKNLPVESVVEVRVGAQVMLAANLDVAAGLANGSCGVVTGYMDHYPVVQFQACKARICLHEWVIQPYRGVSIKVLAVPLKLAYAITIHKSQGQSINMLEIDLGQIWEPGQCYTAFSRATSMETLRVRGFTPEAIICHPKVQQFYDNLEVVG